MLTKVDEVRKTNEKTKIMDNIQLAEMASRIDGTGNVDLDVLRQELDRSLGEGNYELTGIPSDENPTDGWEVYIDCPSQESITIENKENKFNGVFKGNYCTLSEWNGGPLFGYIGEQGVVENLTIENADITLQNDDLRCVGGMAIQNNGIIRHCSFNNGRTVIKINKKQTDICIGSFVGYNAGIIQNGDMIGDVTSSLNCNNLFIGGIAGGICGINSETEIEHCTSSMSKPRIQATNLYLGGLIGYNNGTYSEDSRFSPDVDYQEKVGYQA